MLFQGYLGKEHSYKSLWAFTWLAFGPGREVDGLEAVALHASCSDVVLFYVVL